MSDYRFHLQKYRPGIKTACPECKKVRCFTRYIDEEGIIEFPDYVGRCDHENSCGYHYTPKDYFHDNPDMKPKDWDDNAPIYNNKVRATKGKEEPKPVEPSFIPMEFVSKSLSAYRTANPLYKYLCGIIGEDETKHIFRLYLVGTGKKWGGCTVFWQIDTNGNVHSGCLLPSGQAQWQNGTPQSMQRDACNWRLLSFSVCSTSLKSAILSYTGL